MIMSGLTIVLDDLTDPRIAEFLEAHIADMRATSPPESKHALDLDGLRQPDISFWTGWSDDELVVCGALKQLSHTHGEIKSMRTDATRRKAGFGRKMLEHIINEAHARQYQRLSLETGSMAFFYPAHRLYRDYGFRESPPFADYVLDDNSIFMTLELS